MCMHSHTDHDGKNERNFRNSNETKHRSFWRSKAAVVMLGFAAIAGFFLITEHWAHLYGYWPFLFILACPLMHIFMHHGHGDHGGHSEEQRHQHGDNSSTKPWSDKGGQP